MEEVVRYQTIDGREFASKKAAQEHIEDEICRIVDPLAHKLVHVEKFSMIREFLRSCAADLAKVKALTDDLDLQSEEE
jgi:hypothetical protein